MLNPVSTCPHATLTRNMRKKRQPCPLQKMLSLSEVAFSSLSVFALPLVLILVYIWLLKFKSRNRNNKNNQKTIGQSPSITPATVFGVLQEIPCEEPLAQALSEGLEKLKCDPRNLVLQKLSELMKAFFQRNRFSSFAALWDLVAVTRGRSSEFLVTEVEEGKTREITARAFYVRQAFLGNGAKRRVTFLFENQAIRTDFFPWMVDFFKLKGETFEGEFLVDLSLAPSGIGAGVDVGRPILRKRGLRILVFEGIEYIGRRPSDLAQDKVAVRKHEEWRATHFSGPLMEHFTSAANRQSFGESCIDLPRPGPLASLQLFPSPLLVKSQER
jgi:hypothetical protein